MLGSLEGYVVAVTADRRAAEQAELLERRGARVIHGPCIRTLALSEEDVTRAATEALLADPPDYLVANTAIGIRGWLGGAAAWGLDDELAALLRNTRILARGPKAAGAVTAAGAEVWWTASSEQLDEVAERLLAEPLAGRRVAFQHHGDERQDVTAALRAAGAEVVEVRVYRWTRPEDTAPARSLIAAVAHQRVDAVTFTASPAVDNFLEMAGEEGLAAQVREALAGPVVPVCVGPVCVGTARRAGLLTSIAPGKGRLGTMLRVLVDELAERRVTLSTAAGELELQGHAVAAGPHTALLTDKERCLLEALVERPGAVVARERLWAAGWAGPLDDRSLEVTIGRLRRKLGPAGSALHAVVKRGYLLDLTAVPVTK